MGRYAHACSLLPDGRVIAAGGYDGCTGGDVDTIEVYNPNYRLWTPYKFKLPYTSECGSMLNLDGIPYYVGG